MKKIISLFQRNYDGDRLIPHGSWGFGESCFHRSFESIRDFLMKNDYEGIVWHHPDGRMVKIKKRDFAKS